MKLLGQFLGIELTSVHGLSNSLLFCLKMPETKWWPKLLSFVANASAICDKFAVFHKFFSIF